MTPHLTKQQLKSGLRKAKLTTEQLRVFDLITTKDDSIRSTEGRFDGSIAHIIVEVETGDSDDSGMAKVYPVGVFVNDDVMECVYRPKTGGMVMAGGVSRETLNGPAGFVPNEQIAEGTYALSFAKYSGKNTALIVQLRDGDWKPYILLLSVSMMSECQQGN